MTNYHNPNYGQYGDKAVYGDWNADGIGIGTFRYVYPNEGRWYLNNQVDDGSWDYMPFIYGAPRHAAEHA